MRQLIQREELIKPGRDSPLLTNSSLVVMMVVLDYLRLGYADFEPQCAELVRRGQADREYWLNIFEMTEYSAKTGWMLRRDLELVSAELGLTVEEIIKS